MAKRKIRGNVANMLTYLGTLYHNPGEALKEYISNALDEWREASSRGEVEGPCRVSYLLEKGSVTITYNSPGMDEAEFAEAMNRVADSAKPGSALPQIGQLGIGIFAFNQVGSCCTFYSKKTKRSPTTRVTLTSRSDEYEIGTARRRESLDSPGMKIVISGLKNDPTKLRGPIGAERLQRLFSEKFDSYLREGGLEVTVSCAGAVLQVQPSDVSLPAVGERFREVRVPGEGAKTVRCQLWFDPSGKGRVSIRHAGVPIVEELRSANAYGLEDSVFSGGSLRGHIDADFLKPLPARNGFEENQDWLLLIQELQRIRPCIEAEVEELRIREAAQRLTTIQKQAMDLARDILDDREFRGLELLGGLRRERAPAAEPGGASPGTRTPTGTSSRESGNLLRPGGMRIAFTEIPFEDGAVLHSRFQDGVVQVNTLNRDYRREFAAGTDEQRLVYGATMIGKETIAFNDKSSGVNDFLERLLSFMFEARARIGTSEVIPGKRPRGRPRKSLDASRPKAARRGPRRKPQLPLSVAQTEG